MTLRNEVFVYCREHFGTEPEYLWQTDPNFAVLRRAENKKWYGIIMDIPRQKLGLEGGEKVDILNIKCPEQLLGSFLGQEGFHPAYHMNKSRWLTVRLDGSVSPDQIFGLLEMSFELIKGGKGRARA